MGVSAACSHLDLDGVSIAWEVAGEGLPILCLHAAGHGARDFRLLRQQSPAGCRLLLIDWPGHGRSGHDSRSFTVERCVGLLAAFMNHLGLRSAILLGSEFGAAVALAFSIQHPSRVLGLVLCQPAGLLPSAPPRPGGRIGQIFRRGARSVLRNPSGEQAESEQRMIDALKAHHALQCNQAALSTLALEESLRAGLAQGLCPTVVVLSDKNPAYPLKPFLHLLDPLLSVTPIDQPGRTKLAVFPGRHSPLWDDPARLAQILGSFASSTAPLGTHAHSWTLAAIDWPARGLNQWLCTHPGCHASQALPVDENPNRTLRRR